MATLTAEPTSRPFITRLGWAVSDSWTVVRRHLTHIRYMPDKLLDVTIQPIMFVVLFAYVFGSAIKVPGGDYRSFLMPGIYAQNMMFASMPIMAALVQDMQRGVIDRFRSLPMSRAAVLVGHAGASFIESMLGLVIMLLCGLFVGWRPELGVGSTLGGIGLLMLFAFAMTSVGTFLGLIVKSVEAAQSFGFIVMFPLTFIANTFVPTAGMPVWLRTVANWNPVSAVVQATRMLFGNLPPGTAGGPTWTLSHPVLSTLIFACLLIAIFMPLAVWRFRRMLLE
jgi:ABC-type multidrug transport system permease subunit